MSRIVRTARWVVAALILAFVLGHDGVSAQVTTADLIGRVTDTSGAVLPGVTITITHTGTGATRTQTTSDTGDYAFNLLPIGTYAGGSGDLVRGTASPLRRPPRTRVGERNDSGHR